MCVLTGEGFDDGIAPYPQKPGPYQTALAAYTGSPTDDNAQALRIAEQGVSDRSSFLNIVRQLSDVFEK